MPATKEKFHIPDLILDDYEAPPIFAVNSELELQYFNNKFSIFSDRKWSFQPSIGTSLQEIINNTKFISEFSPNVEIALKGRKIKIEHQIEENSYHFFYRPLIQDNSILGVIISIENYRDSSHEVLKDQLSKPHFEQESVGTWEMDMHTGEILFSGFWKQFMRDGKVNLNDEKNYFLSIISPNDLRKLQKFYETARSKKIDHFHQKYQVTPNEDEYHWISSSSTIEYDVDGKPSRIISVCRDITQEKALEQKWHEEEILLREVERISNLGHYEYDFGKDQWTSSIQLNKIFGISRDFQKNLDSWIKIIHPDDQISMAEYFKNEVIGEQKAFNKVYRIVNQRDQSIKYVHGKGRLILDEEGSPLIMIGTIQDVSENQQREKELVRMSKFAEHTQSGLLVTDPKGITTWVHPSMKIISGHSREDLLGKTPGEVLQGPNTDPAHIQAFNEGIASLKPFKQEILNYNKDGSLMWNEVQISPVFDDNNRLIEFLGVQVDITERKQLEQELALSEYKLRTITNSLPAMIMRFKLDEDDLSKALLYVSDGIEDIYGITAEVAQNDLNQILHKIHPNDLDEVNQDLVKATKSFTTWTGEWRVLQPDHSWKWVRGQASPSRQEDGSVVWDGLVTDITEVKDAQDAEKKANQRFRSLVNSVSGIIWESDEDFNINYVSDQAKTMTGYSAEEWCKLGFWESCLHPTEREKVVNECITLARKGIDHQIEYRFRHKDGHYIWVRDLVNCTLQITGKVLLNGIILDITKEKEKELERRELESKYRYLTENTSDIICVQDTKLRYTFISESIKKVLGFEHQDLLGKSEESITFEEDHFILHQVANFSKKGSNEMQLEYRLKHKDGKILWFRVIKKVIENEKDGSKQVLSSYIDITDRKSAELELIENERKYRFLAENTSDAVVLFNPKWEIQYVSPGVKKIFGVTPEEYQELDAFKQVFPDDLPIIYEVISDIEKGVDEFTREYRMFNKAEDTIWVETRTQVIRHERHVASIITTTNDITQRKTAELKQHEVLEQLQLAVESADIGIWSYDLSKKKLEVNTHLLKMYDLPEKSFKGSRKSLIDKLLKEDVPLFKRAIKRVEKGETVSDLQLKVKRRDGIGHVVMSGSPIKDEKGTVVGTVGINLDITDIIDRKNLLRRKIDQLQIAANSAKIGMFTRDLQNDHSEFNDEILKIYEVDRMEVLNDEFFWEKLVLPEDRMKAMDGINDILSAKSPNNEERFRIKTKSGKIKHIYAAGSLSEGKSGAKEVIGVNMDITDLVENEQKLSKALEEKEVLLKELHHRVKNNLQMVSSILHIKSRKFDNPELINIIKDVNSKIVSVAQVHESLLEQDSTSRIFINRYIKGLLANIVNSFSGGDRSFDCSISVRPYKLESELVFTLGLIIHEVVMNIIKYAYEKGEVNVINLTFNKVGNLFTMQIGDQGKGAANHLPESTGIALIRTLVDNMNGNLKMELHQGVTYQITFPALNSQINTVKYDKKSEERES